MIFGCSATDKSSLSVKLKCFMVFKYIPNSMHILYGVLVNLFLNWSDTSQVPVDKTQGEKFSIWPKNRVENKEDKKTDNYQDFKKQEVGSDTSTCLLILHRKDSSLLSLVKMTIGPVQMEI